MELIEVTPIFFALYAQKNTVKIIAALLGAGADVNHISLHEATPLHAALRFSCDASIIEQLLVCGADIHYTNDRDEYPSIPAVLDDLDGPDKPKYHLAPSLKDPEVIKVLRKYKDFKVLFPVWEARQEVLGAMVMAKQADDLIKRTAASAGSSGKRARAEEPAPAPGAGAGAGAGGGSSASMGTSVHTLDETAKKLAGVFMNQRFSQFGKNPDEELRLTAEIGARVVTFIGPLETPSPAHG